MEKDIDAKISNWLRLLIRQQKFYLAGSRRDVNRLGQNMCLNLAQRAIAKNGLSPQKYWPEIAAAAIAYPEALGLFAEINEATSPSAAQLQELAILLAKIPSPSQDGLGFVGRAIAKHLAEKPELATADFAAACVAAKKHFSEQKIADKLETMLLLWKAMAPAQYFMLSPGVTLRAMSKTMIDQQPEKIAELIERSRAMLPATKNQRMPYAGDAIDNLVNWFKGDKVSAAHKCAMLVDNLQAIASIKPELDADFIRRLDLALRDDYCPQNLWKVARPLLAQYQSDSDLPHDQGVYNRQKFPFGSPWLGP